MPDLGFHTLTNAQRALILGGVGVAVVFAGALVILLVQRSFRRPADDRGDWVKTLVEYKNLRDDGVLSDEEYRKIRTLVEPRSRIAGSAVPDRRPAAADDGTPARPSRK